MHGRCGCRDPHRDAAQAPIVTHDRQSFVDTNITGTLNLLEEAVLAGVNSFVFTSTTSAFGSALSPPEGSPAAWITEDLTPVPGNIYGVTKSAAEELCELFRRKHALASIILRTSRFFPAPDDRKPTRESYDDSNTEANEFSFFGESISRMPQPPICSPSSARPPPVSAGTSSVRSRR